jgi:hypothetical protein
MKRHLLIAGALVAVMGAVIGSPVRRGAGGLWSV